MKLKSIRIMTIALALLAISSQMFAQTHQVSGKVLDATTGEPVIGAGVVASNGGGTVTDYDGNYVITVSPSAVLTFSSIGYKSVSEQVGDRARIDVNLHPDNLLLDEVVLLGYTS